MKRLAWLVFLLPACAIADFGDDGSTTEQESGGTTYVSIGDFSGTDQGAWFDSAHKLNDEFTASGEFPGYVPLTFTCSVTSKIGSVHDCSWTFGLASAQIDGGTAAIATDAQTFQCHVHPKMTAKTLTAALSNSTDALHAPLTGMGSIDDALAGCFAHPIGGTPLPAPSAGTTYVEASSYYATAAYKAKWQAAKTAVDLAFDNICGDTFCGSDFSDLSTLDLVCAVTKSSGNVKGCAWVFGGSYALPGTTGALAVTSQTWSCPITVHATLPQLITLWSSTDNTNGDAIHRLLPGATTSTYDALGGCLP